MEKMIKMMAMAIACVAMCGTAMAAPRGGNGPQASRTHEARQTINLAPKAAQKAPVAAHKQNNRPAPQVAQRKAPAPQQIAHRAPAPQRHEPARRDYCHTHDRHECRDCHRNTTLHTEDWVGIGAGLIGGLIAGIAIGG